MRVVEETWGKGYGNLINRKWKRKRKRKRKRKMKW
jgi:hypothetical protein